MGTATTLTRQTHPSSPHTKPTSLREQAQDGAAHGRRTKGRNGLKKDPPPLIQKVGLAAQIYGLQGLMETMLWFQDWREWFYPPDGGPNIVKAYECRPRMGVRIFFPRSYDLTSPQTLPTVFTIHGGGFCIGIARDDDGWNRAFADSQNMLVISLPYSKAPRAPFPAALEDLGSLYLAVMGDESLPIDRTSSSNSRRRGGPIGRVALLGFDAGANLALGLSQLPDLRRIAAQPSAVVSVCGFLDLERSVEAKHRNRPYKSTLPAPRNSDLDVLANTHMAYVWSYVPYGHDLRDPLLSPALANWSDEVGGDGGIPAHICLVGAELDMLAHESWRMACRLVRDGGVRRGDGRRARWRVPDPESAADVQRVCGRAEPGDGKGRLELVDDDVQGGEEEQDGLDAQRRFGFEVKWEADGDEEDGSVKWILVPDVMHGFDRQMHLRADGEETARDAQLKTIAYVDAVGRWLRGTVWHVTG